MAGAVPEFHRQALDEAAQRVEHARAQLEATALLVNELDAILGDGEFLAAS
jgi:hypothetical protein